MKLLTTTLAAILCAFLLVHAGAQGSTSAFVSLPSPELASDTPNARVFRIRNNIGTSRRFSISNSILPANWTIERFPTGQSIEPLATADFTISLTPTPFVEPVPITFSLRYEEPPPFPWMPPTIFVVESTVITFIPEVPTSYLFTEAAERGPWAEERLIASATVAGGYGYFGGGLGPSFHATATMWRTRNGLEWEPISTSGSGLPTEPPDDSIRIGGLAILNGECYVLNNPQYGEAALYQWNVGAGWALVGEGIRAPVEAGTAALTAFAGRLWLIGGLRHAPPYTSNETLRSWGPGEAEWRVDSEVAPYPARVSPLLAPTATRLFLIGGGDPDIQSQRTDVWSTTNGTDWQQLTATLPDARSSYGIGALGEMLYLTGGRIGESNSALGDLWALNPADNQWIRLSATAFPGRMNPTLLVLPHRTLLLGGADPSHPAESDSIWYLDTPIPVTETGWMVE